MKTEEPVKVPEPIKMKADVNTLPVRSYLDQTVVPLLLQGMSELV